MDAAATPSAPLLETGPVTWELLAAYVQDAFARGESGVYRRALEQFDQLLVHGAMTKTHGNRAAADELLGLSHPTLRAKLRGIAGREDEKDYGHRPNVADMGDGPVGLTSSEKRRYERRREVNLQFDNHPPPTRPPYARETRVHCNLTRGQRRRSQVA